MALPERLTAVEIQLRVGGTGIDFGPRETRLGATALRRVAESAHRSANRGARFASGLLYEQETPGQVRGCQHTRSTKAPTAFGVRVLKSGLACWRSDQARAAGSTFPGVRGISATHPHGRRSTWRRARRSPRPPASQAGQARCASPAAVSRTVAGLIGLPGVRISPPPLSRPIQGQAGHFRLWLFKNTRRSDAYGIMGA